MTAALTWSEWRQSEVGVFGVVWAAMIAAAEKG